MTKRRLGYGRIGFDSIVPHSGRIVIDHDKKRSSFFVQRIDVAALVQFPDEAQIGKVLGFSRLSFNLRTLRSSLCLQAKRYCFLGKTDSLSKFSQVFSKMSRSTLRPI